MTVLWLGLSKDSWWAFHLTAEDTPVQAIQRRSKDMTPEARRREWQKQHGASIVRRPAA